jgi:hypothetical protein
MRDKLRQKCPLLTFGGTALKFHTSRAPLSDPDESIRTDGPTHSWPPGPAGPKPSERQFKPCFRWGKHPRPRQRTLAAGCFVSEALAERGLGWGGCGPQALGSARFLMPTPANTTTAFTGPGLPMLDRRKSSSASCLGYSCTPTR